MANPLQNIRAVFADALAQNERRELPDPPREEAREVEGIQVWPGQWDGAPYDKLPPLCPVTPLGYNGGVCFYVNSRGDLVSIATRDWNDNTISSLFAETPHFKYWAWPRFAAPKSGQAGNPVINGLDVRNAKDCLLKAAHRKGPFNPLDDVRGRGAWRTKQNGLIWHAGDGLYQVEGKQLKVARPGVTDDLFYAQRPPIIKPWREPVDIENTPAHDIFALLKTWNWERPKLDPVLVLGQFCGMFLNAALRWRPHMFSIGDRGVGKTTLRELAGSLLSTALHSTTETTPAGIYQQMEMDALAVAVDELENKAYDDRASRIVDLARIASSKDGKIMRGSADHSGVIFRISSCFFLSAINPPPMETADKSRFAILNLYRLPPAARMSDFTIDEARHGRMLLRQLMQAWPGIDGKIDEWRGALREAGLDQRGQDTYGTTLGLANVVLGDEAMAAAGFELADERIGAHVAFVTQAERAEQTDNWRDCLELLFQWSITEWQGGSKPTVGRVLHDFELGPAGPLVTAKDANDRLQSIGVAVRRETEAGEPTEDWDGTRVVLAIPVSPLSGVARVFRNTKWKGGVWASALKQAPPDVVIRDRGARQNVKINRVTARCLLVDLTAYDAVTGGGDGG